MSKQFLAEYETDATEVKIGARDFNFFVPGSIDRFTNTQDIFRNFPLWAKIWEASLILADYLAAMPFKPEKRFLEIGAGLGVVGIVAASFGHNIIMTEYNKDARNFARANAQKNLSREHPNLQIVKLDWNKPHITGRFDYIIGSEVIYNQKDFKPLLKLFRDYLKPGGEVILSEGIRKTSLEFFKKMEESFQIKARKKSLRSKDKKIEVVLARMRSKISVNDEKNSLER